ncbi:alpha/beta hydrolase family protein [Chitinophaga agrisoli]|nr:prolyl oligopeptidase family serine peptidase [Chitinophaga agrisoli]
MQLENIKTFQAKFTEDNRYVIYPYSEDSLAIVTLGTSSVSYIPDANNFQLSTNTGNTWLAYNQKSSPEKFIAMNIETGEKKTFSAVRSFLFAPKSDDLLLQRERKQGNIVEQSLEWLTLNNGKIKTIWTADINRQKIVDGSFLFDQEHSQLAFMASQPHNINKSIPQKTIWHYKKDNDKAILLLNEDTLLTNNKLEIDRLAYDGFNRDGSKLFFTLRDTDIPRSRTSSVQVDVWSYQDPVLQSQQLYELNNGWKGAAHYYTAVININNRHVTRLTHRNEEFVEIRTGDEKTNNYVILSEPPEINLISRQTPYRYYLQSVSSGEKRKIEGQYNISLSPSEKYIIYYNPKDSTYYSYEISSSITRNLTKGLSINWLKENHDHVHNRNTSPIGIAAWLGNDTAVLIYDHFDIWQIDPKGINAPVNITNGYGREHNIIFNLALYSASGRSVIYDPREEIILTAFNTLNKKNGFYSKKLGDKGDPDLLSMTDNIYYSPRFFIGSQPLYSTNKNAFILKRESAAESPNYFFTTNFTTYQCLTNIHPETQYNWLTSELHTFQVSKKFPTQGTLYKPDNFDPNKKYPVIFYYYQKLTPELNRYHFPSASVGPINIPWFVSNGYLVFTPDIYFQENVSVGESALATLTSAAQYLSTFPFIDPQRMGIQGCSFGGYETNYIVTHTNLFAAACSQSGVSDCTSAYLSLTEYGNISGTYGFIFNDAPWQNPNLFMSASPILRVNDVTTPFLIAHNKGDKTVPFSQSLEFFLALREARKKVWLLQYDDGGHTIDGESSAIDYSIRLMQFFDHYLKDKPAPKWMTHGIPAREKGVVDGLSSDDKAQPSN